MPSAPEPKAQIILIQAFIHYRHLLIIDIIITIIIIMQNCNFILHHVILQLLCLWSIVILCIVVHCITCIAIV